MLDEPLRPEVHNQYVIEGNVGILECSVPIYFKQYVTTLSWIREPNFMIENTLENNYQTGK